MSTLYGSGRILLVAGKESFPILKYFLSTIDEVSFFYKYSGRKNIKSIFVIKFKLLNVKILFSNDRNGRNKVECRRKLKITR